ncbi:MAG: hypothetical protein QOG71_2912 [Pyrinomonadaceae bacterium]|nr:hypothetical protein [Pyrinomonadaceae bacterium]
MRQTITAYPKTFLTVVLVFVSCLILLVSNYSITKGSGVQENRPQVINRTSGFQPSSLTEKDGDYIMLLKNNYNKNINGYIIGIGAGGKVSVDLTVGSRVIIPGHVAEERIPISNLRASSEGGTLHNSITILAVLFEDGTSEGIATAIAEIKERRAGAKIQLKRILSLIQDSLASPSATKMITLTQLKGQIASLSEEAEDTTSTHSKKGFRTAKEDALINLENLEQTDIGLQEGLIRLKSNIEKRITRL